MPRTLADYLDIAEHAAGGQVDAAVRLIDLINDAGRYLIHMHGWAFLERPRALLSLVADQDYVALPADFGQLVAIGNTSDYDWAATSLIPTDQLERLRSAEVYDATHTYLSLQWPTQTSTTANAGAPRLAVFPVPTENVADRLWLNYLAGWTTLSAMTAVPNLPAGVEPLLVTLVRAFARGETSGEGAAPLLEVIERSAMVRSLKASYGMTNPVTAPMTGGITQHQHRPNFRRHTTIGYDP